MKGDDMQMMEAQMQIDWFALDFKEFKARLVPAVEAREELEMIASQIEQCEARKCGHGPFKKDGKPDKRSLCEGDGRPVQQLQERGQSLMWEHASLWDFFTAVGLMGDPHGSTD